MALVAPLPAVANEKRSLLWGVPLYWHLLSLDAPTVAVLWAWSFGRVAQRPVSVVSIAVLGVGTWLIYVADRLLDARSPDHTALRERHFFHARHRIALLQGSAIAGALLLSLIVIMPAAARRDDTLLFAAAMLYFASVHLPRIRVRRWFPREVAVGILFALATAVPIWSQTNAVHARLAGPVLVFAGLCTLNCIAIETWERPVSSTRSAAVRFFAVCIAALSIAVLVFPGVHMPGAIELSTACFFSAILLLGLDGLYRRSAWHDPDPQKHGRFLLILRVAADASLLTPVFFILLWHL